MSKDALEIIKTGQKEWADNRLMCFDKNGYLNTYLANIFGDLLEKSVYNNLKKGRGKELKDKNGEKSKMRALHSSSALCVNFFQYLIQKQEVLCEYLNLNDSNTYNFTFEDQYPTLGKQYPANLDVSLISIDNKSDKSYFIESKFTEPYSYGAGDNEFNLLRTSYFSKEPSSINKAAKCFCKLNHIKKFVFDTNKWSIQEYTSIDKNKIVHQYNGRKCNFKYLDAAQLIKHVFALTNSENKVTQKGNKSKFELIYIYFDSPIKEANDEHKNEIKELMEIFKLDEINFRAICYNDVIKNLYRDINTFDKETKKYTNYLYNRYIKPYEK